MLDEAMRYRLHGRLEEVLGEEEANALMTQLAPHDVSHLATKDDVLIVKDDVRLLKDDVRLLKGDVLMVKNEVLLLRNDVLLLGKDLTVLGSNLQTELHKTITAQTRQVSFALVGVLATFGGLIIAAAHIS